MKRIVPVLFFSVLFTACVHAQDVKIPELNKKLSIMHGRAFMMFPYAAYNRDTPRGIMSANPNVNEETRIMYDEGKMRLVFFAQEMFKVADRDFFSTTKAITNAPGITYKELISNNDLQSIEVTPTIFTRDEDTFLINSLIVKTSDNTVFRIDAYINRAAEKNKDNFIKLTDYVFKTLIAGSRHVNRKPHTETIKIYDLKLKLKLPHDYITGLNTGIDFKYLSVHKFSNYKDTGRYDLIVYFGNWPWSNYEKYQFTEEDAVIESGRALSEPLNWLVFKDDKRHLYIKEQQLPPNFNHNFIHHIAIICSTQDATNEMTRFVESIQLIK